MFLPWTADSTLPPCCQGAPGTLLGQLAHNKCRTIFILLDIASIQQVLW